MLRIGGNQTTYSQNFLKSSDLTKGLLQKSSILASDLVLEIGSGKGIITKELAKVCKQVLSFEIDPILYKQAVYETASYNNVELINADFLTCRLSSTEYKVFSNIPFLLTSRIVRKLTEAACPPTDSYLIMQEEAVNKFLGLPRESQVSLLLKPWFEFSIFYRFSPSDFKPMPKVSSVMMRMLRRSAPLISARNKTLYEDFVAYATTRWRPTLGESLKNIFLSKQLSTISQSHSIDMTAKPLDLRFEDWPKLFDSFLRLANADKKEAVAGYLNLQRAREQNLKKVYRTRLDRNWRSKA